MSAGTGDAPITLLIADDQPIVLAGLRSMLEWRDDIAVVGAASDGLQAVRLAEELRPDVVLLDIRMPRLDGIEAARRIVAAGTAGAVLMITTFDDEAYLLESARAGASGFVLKDAGPDLLAAAVHSALRGDALIDPSMTRALVERAMAATPRPAGPSPATAALAAFTDRERDMLLGLARGLSNSELAAEFYLSEATIKTHISRILGKIGGRTRVDAVVFAYESGLVRPGSRPDARG